MRSSIEDKEIEILTYQLGRKPRGDFMISSTCSYGAPSVITCSPILEDQYFPTTYWLTCPTRNKKVRRLESAGWISRLKEELDSRQDWMLRLEQSIEDQISVRRGLIDQLDAELEESILTGIGGTAKRFNVKCLHAHLADYIITGKNPIGEKVANLIGEIQCEKECLK